MDYYSKISKGYNDLHGAEQRQKIEIVKRAVTIPKKWLLLDVGCGTGLSSALNCKVIGIDPSLGMLRRNRHAGVLGYAERLPFKDNAFDCVLCLTALHNFDDTKKGLEEMSRVGKNLFIFSVMKKSRNFEQICRTIRSRFRISKVLDEEKDSLFICRNKQIFK
ncbi:MAG TPA: methyltransferase domain-containing protein [Candidatus Nanoarchaeia archaeon]|nr:methyltransferase domain-containing protein [Candidatus Nanoarchaeia archaeon]